MSATRWNYWVPYQADIANALQELRQNVFLHGNCRRPDEVCSDPRQLAQIEAFFGPESLQELEKLASFGDQVIEQMKDIGFDASQAEKDSAGKYVDSSDAPLSGQYKAIVSIDDEFRIAPSYAGGHQDIAAYATKRGAPSVKSAGSFWFDDGNLIEADLTSGHFQPPSGEGYADLLDVFARAVGFDGPRIKDSSW